MKLQKLLALLFSGAVVSTAAFAQDNKTDKAAAAAVNDAAKSSVSWSAGASYDYYYFDKPWNGLSAVKTYFGSQDDFGNPNTKLKGHLDGGSVQIGAGNWEVVGSYRDGHSSLDLPNVETFVSPATSNTPAVTYKYAYADKISFKDKQMDLRLRYSFYAQNQWAAYASLGYFNLSSTAKYRSKQTSISSQVGTNAAQVVQTPNAATLTLSRLSGDADQRFGSLGLGLARSFEVASDTYFFLKGEAAALAGSAKGQNASGAKYDPVTGVLDPTSGTGSSTSTGTKLGVKASVTGRLSYNVSQKLTLSVEGGGEFWTFGSSGTATSRTSGLLGRAVAQYRF